MYNKTGQQDKHKYIARNHIYCATRMQAGYFIFIVKQIYDVIRNIVVVMKALLMKYPCTNGHSEFKSTALLRADTKFIFTES